PSPAPEPARSSLSAPALGRPARPTALPVSPAGGGPGALSQDRDRARAMSSLISAMAQLSYRRHRSPPEIIQHAIWLYLRFTLSNRDVEELLVERGLDVFTKRCGD